MFLSISLYKLSHNDLRLPNTLNKFHRYSSSTAGMNKRLFWFKNLWDFFTANFSIGNDFPAILCLYLGTSLEFSHTSRRHHHRHKDDNKKKCLRVKNRGNKTRHGVSALLYKCAHLRHKLADRVEFVARQALVSSH